MHTSSLWSLRLPTSVTVQLVDATSVCQSSAAAAALCCVCGAEGFTHGFDNQGQSATGLKGGRGWCPPRGAQPEGPRHQRWQRMETPRIVPKVFSVPEVEARQRFWSRLGDVTLQVGFKPGCVLVFFFFRYFFWGVSVTQSWQTTLYFCFSGGKLQLL